MKSHTKTLLEELTGIVPEKEPAQIIEVRGCHIIISALNLLESIKDQYGENIANEMERRLLNGIRAKNSTKFARGAKKLSNENNNED